MSESSFVDAKLDKMESASSPTFEVSCFDAKALLDKHNIDSSDCVWMEIQRREKLYSLVLKHVSKQGKGNLCSFTPKQETGNQSLVDRIVGLGEAKTAVSLTFGLGVAEFEHEVDGEVHKLWALHQRRGPVVGTAYSGPQMWQTLVVLCQGKENKAALTHFAETILNASEESEDNEFHIYRWDVEDGYWDETGVKTARSLNSVVLPAETKDKITSDLDAFLTRETYAWYTEHGIPYKRSYLFYGVPGGGKTSLLQALAGKYKRNLCILQPTDPRFTDDKLADAIKDAPARSIIVLEDVDALFDKHRSSTNAKIQITFSGLLNALDGISNPDGQIFILTTNFREHLDAALIRNGRVDLHIQFTHAQPEQMRQLFLQFYPAASPELAHSFSQQLRAALGPRHVSMAALQHYFISQRTKSPEDAVRNVAQVLEDMDEKDTDGVGAKSSKDELTSKDELKQNGTKGGGTEEQGKKKKKKAKTQGAVVHVHIHQGGSKSASDEGEDSEEEVADSEEEVAESEEEE